MRIIAIIILVLTLHFAQAQNLVTNGDFESNIGCASLTGWVIHDAPPWNPIGNIAYYNTCSSNILFSVPINSNQLKGYQWPHSGNAYSGFNSYLAIGTNVREYILAQLNDTLINGKEYCIEFYINLWNASKHGIDAIGIYFSDSAVSCPTFTCLLTDTPQVVSPLGIAITDTLNWTKVSGSFIANGGERFVAIGNFLPDNQLTIVLNDSAQPYSTYYYIDDVSVFKCDSSSAINDLVKQQQLIVFPNPANNLITVSNSKQVDELCLLDVSGKVVLQQKQVKVIDVSELVNGLYMLRCKFQDGEVLYKKIVVQHE
jgi:hypothetical protein